MVEQVKRKTLSRVGILDPGGSACSRMDDVGTKRNPNMVKKRATPVRHRGERRLSQRQQLIRWMEQLTLAP